MHDIYYGTALPPDRKPIQLVRPDDRIGVPYLRCPEDKIVAVVETSAPDRNTPFKAPDADSRAIAGHIVEFLEHEVARGRVPRSLLPLQSGVGNVANAVLAGLEDSSFEGVTAYTEVIQDGMLGLLSSGTMVSASATAFSLSPEGATRFEAEAEALRERILLRPQEISNHPEIIRRLGVLAMNGLIEADIYGNVNSTHVMGSRIQNGIGGSGEHDVAVIVTEQGLADLRGLPPRRRAELIIERCAHPDYRPLLRDYYERALRDAPGRHTPHLLGEALSWHTRYLAEGSMMPPR
jgi:succinyl-CoA:acetate CoA-transferase